MIKISSDQFHDSDVYFNIYVLRHKNSTQLYFMSWLKIVIGTLK